MDGAAQTETPTAEQTHMQGVGGAPSAEVISQPPSPETNPDSTPQQPYSITGLAQEASVQNIASSVPAAETSPQVSPPMPINTEGIVQPQPAQPDIVRNQTPEESMASYQPSPTPETPTPPPDLASQVQIDPGIAQAEAALAVPQGEVQLNKDPRMTVGAGETAPNPAEPITGIDPNAQASTEAKPNIQNSETRLSPEMQKKLAGSIMSAQYLLEEMQKNPNSDIVAMAPDVAKQTLINSSTNIITPPSVEAVPESKPN